ncbi:beta-galactosidase [Cellulomonas algicola]|uniref:beta-galactosidase n=1 Tax=Cellulomonas algicola TaxID=2071633 RepID=UPI001C3F54CB|nr:beta-galactosidase [Cellulomonas algicola]
MPDHLPRVRPTGWSEPLTRPAMANDEDVRPGLALTSRWLERDGTPWIPVSGEVHYSRVPRSRWRETLRLVRSGGVDVVATYVIWAHHEPLRGAARFDDGLDVAAFVRTCAEEGLRVVLRIGPWCHGEVRNGGFPDWVQDAPVRHRTDDPGYLDLVRGWFGRLGVELGALCGPDGPVLGIQLDNELYDQPGHLATLKRLAREAGLSAPLWTATAWGGAQLPAGEVLPLYGGYGDGFWVDADAGWHDTFRAHYQVSHTWDDPGIGADVRGAEGAPTVDRDTAFPPATCELGGGMATTYHRRPVPSALDVAAVAHGKVASGSAWQGYYMYAGGSNPGPDLQESHATGYPNDLPSYDYDFHAPVGAAGLLAPSHAALRTQHAFLAAFGPVLATMPSTLPDVLPSGVDDSATLRWSVREADGTGFVFVVWHQPHVPLPTLRGVQVQVDVPSGPVVLPSRPTDVPAGTLARWPFGLDVTAAGGVPVRLRWATASALTTLPDGTLVLLASAGVPVEVVVDPDVRVSGDGWTVAPGVRALDERTGGVVVLHAPRGRAAHADDADRAAHAGGAGGRVLVVGAADADRVWVLDGPDGRVLLRSADPLWLEDDEVVVRASSLPLVQRWTPDGWQRLDVRAGTGRAADDRSADAVGDVAAGAVGAVAVVTTPVRAAGEPAVSYGAHEGRASAPSADRVAELSAEHRLADVGVPVDGTVRHLHVAWAGDVAQLLVDRRVVADRFWDGTPWDVDLDVLPGAEGDRVSVRVLPLHPDAAVWLPAEAADRRRSVEGPLGSLDAVALTRSRTWRAPLT